MIGFIIWLIRLEGNVNQNEKDICVFKEEKKDEFTDVNSKLDELNRTLTSLCISFADLSGYIRRCNEEKE
jgi:hypothetical protein